MLGGCAGPSAPLDRGDPTLDWPPAASAGPGRIMGRIRPELSHAWIAVEPAGPLAKLGHAHLIGGPVIEGVVVMATDPAHSAVDLAIELGRIDVDRPEWRTEAGLQPLDEAARTGTRANLMGPAVLDAARYPRIELRARGLHCGDQGWELEPVLLFQARRYRLKVPVELMLTDGNLVASGAFELNHADLGLQPFSAAGGALKVADPIRIRFRITAEAGADATDIIGHWACEPASGRVLAHRGSRQTAVDPNQLAHVGQE
ncbi:MAG: hypothetical protein Kow0020_13220 [Wenzhouxiangellaceae bacterium]